jgi:hypothetical protein
MMLNIPSNFEESSLRVSMASKYFKYPSVAVIAIMAPLAVDISLDAAVAWSSRANAALKLKRNQVTEQMSRHTVALQEKGLFLLALIVVPVVALLPDNYPNLGLAFCCCHKFQCSIIADLLMVSLCRMNKKYWGVCSTMFLLIAIPLSCAILVYADNILAATNSPLQYTYQKLQQAGLYLLYVNAAVFLWNTGRWFKHEMWLKMRAPPEDLTVLTEKERHAASVVYYSGAFLLSSATALCFFMGLTLTANSLASWTEVQLLLYNIGFLCPEITLVILSMRTAKYEVLQGLVSVEFAISVCRRSIYGFVHRYSYCHLFPSVRVIGRQENLCEVHLP